MSVPHLRAGAVNAKVAAAVLPRQLGRRTFGNEG